MIAPEKIREVEQLLSVGTASQRQIARLAGVSRAVVGQIAAGARPDYEARRQARQDELHVPLGPKGRCPTCGGMVYLPCLLCKVRSQKDEERAKRRERQQREREAQLRRLLWLLRNPPPPRRQSGWDPPCRKVG